MLILALDTALTACSAGLFDSTTNQRLAERFESMQRGHAERLAGMTDEVVASSGHGFDDIDRIAVTIGPGSFTGVRTGVSFARGLALALECPAVGVTTLGALAANVAPQAGGRPIAVIIDARRDEIYFQLFSPQLKPLCEPQALPVDVAANQLPAGSVLGIGSGVPLVAEHANQLVASDLPALPQPSAIAELAARHTDLVSLPAPVYLRAPDAKAQTPLLKLAKAEIEITEVGAAHADVLTAIHAQSFVKAWPAAELSGIIAMPGTQAMLACKASGDKSPCGFIIFRQAAQEAEIITIAIAPAARRRQIGTSLLDAAMTRLRAHGCTEFHLEVDESSDSAMAFYQALGFVVSGHRKNYYKQPDGTRADAILMHRAI